jgi:hypothetical protein
VSDMGLPCYVQILFGGGQASENELGPLRGPIAPRGQLVCFKRHSPRISLGETEFQHLTLTKPSKIYRYGKLLLSKLEKLHGSYLESKLADLGLNVRGKKTSLFRVLRP